MSVLYNYAPLSMSGLFFRTTFYMVLETASIGLYIGTWNFQDALKGVLAACNKAHTNSAWFLEREPRRREFYSQNTKWSSFTLFMFELYVLDIRCGELTALFTLMRNRVLKGSRLPQRSWPCRTPEHSATCLGATWKLGCGAVCVCHEKDRTV